MSSHVAGISRCVRSAIQYWTQRLDGRWNIEVGIAEKVLGLGKRLVFLGFVEITL